MKFRKCVWASLLGVFALLVSLFLNTACLDTKLEDIKVIPLISEDYQQYSMWTRQDFGKRFHHQIGHNSVKINVPQDLSMLLLDSQYRGVDFFFFLQFNQWFKELKFNNGIMPINQPENLDCDNFALLYKSLFSISHYKSNVEHEPAVGLVIVKQVQPFGGIPSGELHMLNIVFTNRDWYVYEPQTGKYISLDEYPNQENIVTIII